MPRHFDGDTLVIATHNHGKLLEFKTVLLPYVRKIISAGELGLPEPKETGSTFAENATLKALAAAGAGVPALADDSGLCVNALGGKPGLFSARWCGSSKDPLIGMERVQLELGASPDRSAYFICVLALAWPDGHTEVVEGRCDGQIVWPPRGNNGHGYDPFFLPDGQSMTFGEMNPSQKQEISHRGQALKKMAALFTTA
ncbi:MAG: RdgB/HAM1 family non-canonical purine NTP pyrophosphatase [Alphaproteobacteria bacterium]|nr:RdgB/HAM1 family non-canonical purine NTP pyrophosphatase [Alphaproteobacteria bacterium]